VLNGGQKRSEEQQRTRKVLVAEDNPVFQTMLRNLLVKWDYEVILAGDGVEAWEHLQAKDGPRLAMVNQDRFPASAIQSCEDGQQHLLGAAETCRVREVNDRSGPGRTGGGGS
jgi:CheY-like chemotaxis protein